MIFLVRGEDEGPSYLEGWSVPTSLGAICQDVKCHDNGVVRGGNRKSIYLHIYRYKSRRISK